MAAAGGTCCSRAACTSPAPAQIEARPPARAVKCCWPRHLLRPRRAPRQRARSCSCCAASPTAAAAAPASTPRGTAACWRAATCCSWGCCTACPRWCMRRRPWRGRRPRITCTRWAGGRVWCRQRGGRSRGAAAAARQSLACSTSCCAVSVALDAASRLTPRLTAPASPCLPRLHTPPCAAARALLPLHAHRPARAAAGGLPAGQRAVPASRVLCACGAARERGGRRQGRVSAVGVQAGGAVQPCAAA